MHQLVRQQFGFWTGDESIGEAAYYAYTYPEPEGLPDEPLTVGDWVVSGDGALAVLPYEAVRTSCDPRTTLLAFCQSAYEAGARVSNWDTTAFASRWSPNPGQLDALRALAVADCLRPSGVS
jgi:hypothetical protein